jgi:hypothetical protein
VLHYAKLERLASEKLSSLLGCKLQRKLGVLNADAQPAFLENIG